MPPEKPVLTEPPKRRGSKHFLKRFILFALAILVIAGAAFSWKVYSSAAKATGDHNPFHLLSIFWPPPLDQSNGRANILLTGYSADDPGHQGAQLTDSIMVLSIDQSTHKAVVISIPRDLYVDVPGHGYEKINAAYEQGGMNLLTRVISQDLGLDMNYHALINYTAFRDAVNAVGGVIISINSSDPRGVYDPNTSIKLPNGPVKLNGQQALALSRSRGDGYGSYGFPAGDFDRIKYQQQILLALKTKADSGSVITNPFRVIKLVDAAGNNVQSDLKLGGIESLYKTTRKINNSDIQTVSLNKIGNQQLLRAYTTYGGQSALIPLAGLNNYSNIQAALQSALSN